MKRLLLSSLAFFGFTIAASAQCASGYNQLSGVFACQLAGGAAPVITSPSTLTCVANTSCTYTITATNTPTSWSAPSLPTGLSLTGAAISGSPTTAATTNVTLGATNGSGTGNETLSISVDAVVGQTGVLGGGGGTPGYMYAMSVTAGTTGTLQALAINLTGATSSMYLALYDSNGSGSSPGTLLAATPTFNGMGGWQTVNVTTPHAVTSGHAYYLAAVSQSGNQISNGGGCCTVYYQGPGVTTPPSPWTGLGNFPDGLSMYGIISVP